MTDKMPDEIYAYFDSMAECVHHWSEDKMLENDGTKYISEQKHAEEIAALKAEHRALQEVHSDSLKFINFLQAQHRAEIDLIIAENQSLVNAMQLANKQAMAGLCDEIDSISICYGHSMKSAQEVLIEVKRLIKQRISDE